MYITLPDHGIMMYSLVPAAEQKRYVVEKVRLQRTAERARAQGIVTSKLNAEGAGRNDELDCESDEDAEAIEELKRVAMHYNVKQVGLGLLRQQKQKAEEAKGSGKCRRDKRRRHG